MVKLLIFLLIGYFALKIIKSVLGAGSPTSVPGGNAEADQIDDLMVQDLNCETYISKRDAVQAVQNGRTLYFCSAKCRDAYLADI